MNRLPRKLTFQLTPLLDLLLIVIFAQYLEVAHSSQQQVESLRQHSDARLSRLEEQRRDERNRREIVERQASRLDAELADLRRRLDKETRELTEALRRAVEREEQVGDIVAELFQVPESLIDETLEPDRTEQQIRSAQEVASLRRAFREFASKRGREVVKHLLTYQELRKRCDIWELYIEENGTIQFHTGSHTFVFRISSPQEFSDIMFQRYKSLPQPKGLVIILLSYADARAGPRHAAINGLPLAADRMREDAAGRTRFEFAVLGFNPTAPSFAGQ